MVAGAASGYVHSGGSGYDYVGGSGYPRCGGSGYVHGRGSGYGHGGGNVGTSAPESSPCTPHARHTSNTSTSL